MLYNNETIVHACFVSQLCTSVFVRETVAQYFNDTQRETSLQCNKSYNYSLNGL